MNDMEPTAPDNRTSETGRPEASRTVARVATALTLLLLLVAGFYLVENWRGKHAWNKHRKTWQAKGEKFDIREISPRQVPNSQNFAMTPILAPVLNYTQTAERVIWGDTNGTARLNRISATLADPHRERKADQNESEPSAQEVDAAVTLGKLETGAFADLRSTAEFYLANTNYPQAASSASDAETILTALSKFGAELEELAEEAAARPYSRFPIQYETEPGWAILLPHLSSVKQLTLLTQVRAVARLHAGNAQGAVEDLRLGLRLSATMSEEPLLINHLVRIATLHLCLQTVREGLHLGRWEQAQLTDIQEALGQIDVLSEYENAMRGERALSVGGIDFLRRERFGSGKANGYMEFEGPILVAARLAPAGWFYQNMLKISEMHQDYFLRAVNAEEQRVSVEVSQQGENAVAALPRSPYSILARLTLPALTAAVRRSAVTHTFVDASRVACALERYRIAKGTWPDKVDAIAPEFIERIPHDVIDGQPLRYRKNENGGVILYSIGWNEKDDGGIVAFRQGDRHKRNADAEQGDWVFSLPQHHER